MIQSRKGDYVTLIPTLHGCPMADIANQFSFQPSLTQGLDISPRSTPAASSRGSDEVSSTRHTSPSTNNPFTEDRRRWDLRLPTSLRIQDENPGYVLTAWQPPSDMSRTSGTPSAAIYLC